MDDVGSTRLAQQLEEVSEESLRLLLEVIRLPVDTENGALLRAQVSAAMVGLNTQLRADHLRLRAAREDKALERLVATIQEKMKTVPSEGKTGEGNVSASLQSLATPLN